MNWGNFHDFLHGLFDHFLLEIPHILYQQKSVVSISY